jgi:hypothetical protein
LIKVHTLELVETVKVRRVWNYHFIPGDQAQWDALRAAAQASQDVINLLNVFEITPSIAPTDPAEWLMLAGLIMEPREPFRAAAEYDGTTQTVSDHHITRTLLTP